MYNGFSVFLSNDTHELNIIHHVNEISNLKMSAQFNGINEKVYKLYCFGIEITLDCNQSYADDIELDFSTYKYEILFETHLGVHEVLRTEVALCLSLLFAQTFCERYKTTCMVVKNLQEIVWRT